LVGWVKWGLVVSGSEYCGVLMIWLGFGVVLGMLGFRNVSSVCLVQLFSGVVDAGR
jgi:hypothetical protein